MDVKAILKLWGVGVVKTILVQKWDPIKIFLSHWCHNKDVKIESFEKNLTDKREGLWGLLERAKGFEPSTSTLARLRSTPELRPLIISE